MKPKIHPTVNEVKVACTGCGSTFTTLSTMREIFVSICNVCHPFFTGAKKLLDTEGRIERFERKYREAQANKKTVAKPAKKK